MSVCTHEKGLCILKISMKTECKFPIICDSQYWNTYLKANQMLGKIFKTEVYSLTLNCCSACLIKSLVGCSLSVLDTLHKHLAVDKTVFLEIQHVSGLH